MPVFKLFLPTTIFIATFFSVVAQTDVGYKLPEKWAGDFTITLAHHGSMNGSYTDARFTYDSCIYKIGSHTGGKQETRIYLLKESDKFAILQKLRDLKAGNIKSENGVNVVNDGWSQSVCFDVHCIDGGPSVDMEDEDRNKFLTVYRYLEEFAVSNSHPVKTRR